jgi:NAD(P)-dependent dehydrogenase (short-subunit alcohol dehydrogenase family)
VDGYRGHPQLAARSRDAHGDLAPIRDEDLGEHRHDDIRSTMMPAWPDSDRGRRERGMRRGGANVRGGVVVTGAWSAIGRATAMRLARIGFSVFGGVAQEEDGDGLRNASRGRIVPVRLDVTDAASIAGVREQVARALAGERLAGIVNNAGVVVASPLEFVPLDRLREQLEVNAVGPVAVSQAFLPMLRSSQGRIVHIGSNSGLVSTPFLGPYCGSKFALEALASAMRMELARWGIEVSIVDPGTIDTPAWERSERGTDALLATLPREASELYGWAIPKLRAASERAARTAAPASEVARTVVRALTERRPKARYIVGRDARIQATLARFLPPKGVDRLVMRYLGL